MPRRAQDPLPPRDPPARLAPVFIWPTPEKSNLLFYVEQDGNLPANKGWKLGDRPWDRTNYPDHKLIHVTPQDKRGWSRWYYASDRVLEDDYNWEFTQADIGGTRFNAVRRSYLVPRVDFSPTSPAAGAAMPTDPVIDHPTGGLPLFPTSLTYVLAGRAQQRTGDDIFDGLFVVESRTYVRKVVMTDLGVDDLNGRSLWSTDTLYYATEVVTGVLTASGIFSAPTNTWWGLQADGTQRKGRQLSEYWYLVTTEQVVSGTFVGGVVDLGGFNTNDDYPWPAVLSEIEFMDWERRDGGVDIYPRYTYDPDDYRGPCHTEVERSWSKNPQTIPAVSPMLPSPVIYGSPYFPLKIRSCLHWDVEAHCDIGSEDPIYSENYGSSRTTPATNYVTWPTSLVGYDDQRPFRGGYLRVRKTVFAPS